MAPEQAIRAAYEEARAKGYPVPRRNRSSARKKASSRPRSRTRHRKSVKPRARAFRSNPVIGDSAVALSYEGGQGKRTKKLRGPWEHAFESNDVEIRGRKDGSVVLRSKSGKKLWDWFEV